MLKPLLKGVTDLVYPRVCLSCSATISPVLNPPILCLRCQSKIDQNRPPFCTRCFRHLSDPDMNTLCKECRSFNLYFDEAWGVLTYNDFMRRLLHLFKYGQKTALRHYFAMEITQFCLTYKINLTTYDYVIPVPLHPVRRRERGYNQALLLAEKIANFARIPLLSSPISRIRNTQNQARVHKKERWTNIQGAFKIKNSNKFEQKRILLVDDLRTTGATTSEIARILKQDGATHVGVLTLAIAQSP